jgi:hypothetical protein
VSDARRVASSPEQPARGRSRDAEASFGGCRRQPSSIEMSASVGRHVLRRFATRRLRDDGEGGAVARDALAWLDDSSPLRVAKPRATPGNAKPSLDAAAST